ncbi:uncharacterized protein NECHADRAFT_89118 [Fusarium vanettenii 77-13-4]|uniref:Uncharacterized protein n=1 Tax=Fusarium vanettenii (strain ATCC MYA-4622 / CBS 123669 / FGSC 9596 / NRRL 45880 / 77-13-4) TaxID=660122 RepID=C7ZQA1_FUSV7|nr:uncharacterized protein NECHADRAFT_89118 [Fusarium vanettenii 77-13-4]EEU33809.1 predicted protein [Fusarium vanettenii 77-13-4]
MAVQDSIQCFACSVQFLNPELCFEHCRLYQYEATLLLAKGKELIIEALGHDLSVEIIALLARAQDLLSHHGSLAIPLAPLDDNQMVQATQHATPSGFSALTMIVMVNHRPSLDGKTLSDTMLYFCASHITLKEAMAHTCKDVASSQIMLIKRQRRTWRRRLREDMTKVRLLKNNVKNNVKQLNHAAGSSSYGEEPESPSDCPRNAMITGPANLMSSIAGAEGSAPNATIPPP